MSKSGWICLAKMCVTTVAATFLWARVPEISAHQFCDHRCGEGGDGYFFEWKLKFVTNVVTTVFRYAAKFYQKANQGAGIVTTVVVCKR